MALIKCPECEKEVSDKASVCPNCGLEVRKYIEREKKIAQFQEEAAKEAYVSVKKIKQDEQEQKEKEEKAEVVRKDNIYNSAIVNFNSEFAKDVEYAEELFKSILGWKESEEYYEKCKERIKEVKKLEEKRHKKNKRLVMVISLCSLLIALIALGARNYYVNVIMPKQNYEEAIILLDAGKYTEAQSCFENANIQIDNLKDYVIHSIKNGEYKKSEVAMQYLDSEFVSSDIVQNAYYESAINSIENGIINNYKECYDQIKNEELIASIHEISYKYAVNYFEDGNYAVASTLFESLKSSDLAIEGYLEKSKILLETYSHLEEGKISISQMLMIEENGCYEMLDDTNKSYINSMKTSLQSLQGCFMGGRPYYYCINGTDIYWGDETGCFKIDAIYMFESGRWYTGWGEDIIGMTSDGLKTTLRTYKKTSINSLPDTFAPYIK